VMTERLLDAEDVAGLLNVPTSWVRAETRKSERSGAGLPFIPLGRYRRYDREAVLAWVREQAGGTWRRHQPALASDREGS
jgi:hypothetical protein